MRVQAVHQAVKDDDLSMLKQLIDSDDLAAARDAHGRTPLIQAALLGREQIAKYLLLLYSHCIDLVDKVSARAAAAKTCTSAGERACFPD